MNKKLKIVLVVAVVLVVALVAVVAIAVAKLDTIIETAIETGGPKLTKTTIQLDKIGIRPLSGAGTVSGLVVGTPEGFKAEYTLKLGHAHLDVQPASVLSDKVVIETIVVESPEIILEGGLKENNLTALQKNVNDAVGGGAAAETSESAGAGKKLQVNHFKVTGAKVHLRLSMLAGKNVTITAPDIELKDLGAGPEGITGAELTKLALNAITRDVLSAAGKSIGELGKDVTDAANKAAGAASKEASEAANKATEGLKNIFKKD